MHLYHLDPGLTDKLYDGPGGMVIKNLPANPGDAGSVSWWGRSPREGNGNQLQYSCLGNPVDRGALQAAVYGVTKESDTTTKQQQLLDRRARDHTPNI